MKECKVIAECCGNHMGDLDIAKEMIKTAKLCGADYAKFQKRCPEICVPKNVQSAPHPCPENSFGATYLEHRQKLEFSIDQHRELKKVCDDVGIKYACSVWDVVSAAEIILIDTDYIKIPSACNSNYELLDFVYTNYKKDVHISLGMITKEEKTRLMDYVRDKISRTVLYWTTSTYPSAFEELYLLEIKKLCEEFDNVGYSGHHKGISVDLLSFCLGATWIERHFTLDRTWKGTDHPPALEPDGLRRLCRDLKAAQKALKYKDCEMTVGEIANRKKLRICTR